MVFLVHYMKTWNVTSLILNLGTRSRKVVIFTTRQLYRLKEQWYAFNKRLDGPQSPPEYKKNYCPWWSSKPRPSSQSHRHYANWTISDVDFRCVHSMCSVTYYSDVYTRCVLSLFRCVHSVCSVTYYSDVYTRCVLSLFRCVHSVCSVTYYSKP
jgi:hypothetical protein